MVRGGLAGRGRFAAVAWSLVAENALRCLLVGVLLLAEVHDPVVHGLCLVAGSLVALWPAAGGSARRARGGGSLAFLGGAATGQLLAQAVLTGGPVLLALLGGSPAEVTAMFAALALFRAPYMVVLGTLPQLTHHVTGHVVAGDVAPSARSRAPGGARGRGRASLGASRGAARPGAGARWSSAARSRSVTASPAVLATGCTLAVANVVLMVAALARTARAGRRRVGGRGPRRRRRAAAAPGSCRSNASPRVPGDRGRGHGAPRGRASSVLRAGRRRPDGATNTDEP